MQQLGVRILRNAKQGGDLGNLQGLRQAHLDLLAERSCSQVGEEPIITQNRSRLQVTFQGRNCGESHDGT